MGFLCLDILHGAGRKEKAEEKTDESHLYQPQAKGPGAARPQSCDPRLGLFFPQEPLRSDVHWGHLVALIGIVE